MGNPHYDSNLVGILMMFVLGLWSVYSLVKMEIGRRCGKR